MTSMTSGSLLQNHASAVPPCIVIAASSAAVTALFHVLLPIGDVLIRFPPDHRFFVPSCTPSAFRHTLKA